MKQFFLTLPHNIINCFNAKTAATNALAYEADISKVREQGLATSGFRRRKRGYSAMLAAPAKFLNARPLLG